ncbi:MAG TPA: hypothetical protein DCG12_11640 [Planctomycetaceae bacterium]|nr:hypothetical protein [Planctomycetaceae bacterium]
MTTIVNLPGLRNPCFPKKQGLPALRKKPGLQRFTDPRMPCMRYLPVSKEAPELSLQDCVF